MVADIVILSVYHVNSCDSSQLLYQHLAASALVLLASLPPDRIPSIGILD